MTQEIFSRADKKIYRDGDKLVKVFDANYSKADILNEALNHARVEETDLNVPKIKSIEVVKGKWAIILDYIEGETLEALMQKHPEKEDEYLNMFVDLQRTVLSRKVPMLNKLKDKMQAKTSAASLDATTR
ncbi:MAG: aminoglycoside phosphotransferase, partial [Clostridia bacterium]|nr:aminoglycoside phosphotransferase [Clostridia bacterium]